MEQILPCKLFLAYYPILYMGWVDQTDSPLTTMGYFTFLADTARLRHPRGPSPRSWTARLTVTVRRAAGTGRRRASDGGGDARDQGEADGAPGEGGQRSAAGIVRGAGVAVLGAAARHRRPGGGEEVPPRRQHLHVGRHVGLARGALRPRRRTLPAHHHGPPPSHLRRGGARAARAQATRWVPHRLTHPPVDVAMM
jgi:hypothetical protein